MRATVVTGPARRAGGRGWRRLPWRDAVWPGLAGRDAVWPGLAWRRSARRLSRLRRDPAERPAAWSSLLGRLLARHRLPAAVVSTASAGALAWPAGGPVAAGLAIGYAGVVVVALARRWRLREDDGEMARALDAVTGLAADLRAGLAQTSAVSHAVPVLAASTVVGVRRLAAQVAAALRVSDAAGVRLADLLDRLEADARGLRRVRAGAAAQAAGARATAWLLAGLPVAGLGLGYGMGTDPVHVLLDTPLGALCAGLAGLLQMAGLAWSARLARAVAEVG